MDAIIDHLENNFSFNTKLQFAGFLAIAKHGDISLCSKFVTINYVKENSVYLSKIILKKGQFIIIYLQYIIAEAVAQRCFLKKVFLEISQNSQENTCARVSFLIKLQAAPATLLKKRLWHRCFPVSSAKFLRTPFFIEHLWWLCL